MSVAMICRSSTPVPLPIDPFLVSTLITAPAPVDLWTSIQLNKTNEPKAEPYVHPLVRRSASHMSQRSLEICTESLGSETGSEDYYSSDDYVLSSWLKNREQQREQEYEQDDDDEKEKEEEADDEEVVGVRRKGPATVNYHCSISRRSPCRSFPPPLPSISCRDGPCFRMRPHRRDGRLVVEAVAVPSQNYLHAERQDGRLLLSFINTTASRSSCAARTAPDALQEAEEEGYEEAMELEDDQEEEEEEEVEVVDRGTVVEVKVSTQPQQQSGGLATMKVHRSSIVINKFVSCTPLHTHDNDKENDQNILNSAPAAATGSAVRRSATTATSAAAAAVAASSLSGLPPADGSEPCSDSKLLFTSKRRNREELLRDMRRCSRLRKPLFIWEPCRIATST